MTEGILKRKGESSARLDALADQILPNAGEHRSTKLRRAGCGYSGSILHQAVSDTHGNLLTIDFKSQFKSCKHENLRLLTVLHGVTSLDKVTALRSASVLESNLRSVLAGTGARCLGAIEVEIVRLDTLRSAANAGDDSARKLTVLEQLSDHDLDACVLVHFHGVLDLGNSTLHESAIRTFMLSVPTWSRAPYQIELKGFFSDKSVEDSLRDIAKYLVKGGNDRLEYNVGFGRLPDYDLDAQLWRKGQGRSDRGGETVTNERSLSLSEIAFLDQLWISLMIRRSDNRGYLIDI